MFDNIGFNEVVRLAGVGFFFMLVLMLFLLVFGDTIQKLYSRLIPSSQSRDGPEKDRIPADELARQQEAARRRVQDQHQVQAEDYSERVLKPREAAKQAELEKEYYKFAGPAWKGKGERTRTSDGAESAQASGEGVRRRRDLEGSSKDAAAARKLPESVVNPPQPPPPEPAKPKRVITLPDEPNEGTPQSINIALRGISGRVKKRRFLYTEQVQVLFDWMHKLGYHEKLYTLVTTYPRRDLSQDAMRTLEEADINHDIALVVEEIVVEKDDAS